METMDLRNTLLQAFSEEAPDLLARAEKALLDLEEAAPADQQPFSESLKRALHSLKGSASAIGRSDLRDICHAMEDLALAVSHQGASAAQIDALHVGLQFLQIATATPAEPHNPESVLAMITDPTTAVVSPSTQASSSSELAPSEKKSVTAPTASTNNAAETPIAVAETIRVAVNKIDNMQSSVGELVAIRLQQDDSLTQLNELQRKTGELVTHWRSLNSDIRECRSLLPSASAAKLDSKVSAFSGYVKQIERQLFYLAHQMNSQAGQLNLLCDAMDNDLRAIRMMPLAPFLESFRAVARDAARSLGKNVVLECDDKGIEIDKLVLEHIREPLLHLVRNAVSHGIETPAQRAAAEKPEVGTLRLTAQLYGDYVSLAIMDDGAGFNRDKVLKKAKTLGLVRTDDELTDDKLIDIVCQPGFSTANAVDMVSGRGIGMDVVSTMITELGGAIELETLEEQGSCITLRVPSSLATTQGLILQVGTQRYGIILDLVERIVRTQLNALANIEGCEVLFLDKQPIAITSLAKILHLPELEPRHRAHAYPIVILRTGSQRMALIVDDIPGEMPMIVKPLGPQFENIKMYSGGAILSDGSVMPVLDAKQVITQIAGNARAGGSVQSALSQTDDGDDAPILETQLLTQRVILVVDDSITTRTLERSILEAAGYRVLVATDGEEAVDIMRIEDGIALVVTDLEMPRMNGLELCKHIRNGRHKHLPIIMVTSVGNETEMRKGLAAGADAYIVKGNFSQDHFLATVRRFVDA